MIRQVILSPVVCLMLMITIILGVCSSPVQAQQTSSLVFSTYLGGKTPYDPNVDPFTFAQNAASDAQGNTYVTGATTVSDLPGTSNAYQLAPAPNSTMSAFVAKYNPVGQLLWCTYLGGNLQSMGIGVAARPNGGVAVMGITTSDASFPLLNPCQPQNNGLTDYFVTVFDANGNLTYSTYLGGSGVEGQSPSPFFPDNSNNGNGVAVDAAGLVYVAGMTTSSGSGTNRFPVTDNALQKDLAGTRNACLCIIDPTKSGLDSLVYSSFLGGNHDNQGHSVAVNASGSLITVAGFLTSSNFPTTANAYRASAPPGGFSPNCSNGFVTQFQSSQPGSLSSQYTMRYSTYLGADSSTARDDTYGMVMDPTGLIVATGRTQSKDFPKTAEGVPTIFRTAPYLQEGASGDQPFLVKINPALNGAASLVYATFLGGGTAAGATEPWGSFCTSVGVDARGAVYVGGETNAQGAAYVPANEAPQTFPYTPNALFTALLDSRDAIFMQISPGGANLGYSTYLGGPDNASRTYGLAVDPARNVVLSGLTFSNNFPLKNPAQTYPGNGNQNAFVTKFAALPGGAPTGACLLLLLDD